MSGALPREKSRTPASVLNPGRRVLCVCGCLLGIALLSTPQGNAQSRSLQVEVIDGFASLSWDGPEKGAPPVEVRRSSDLEAFELLVTTFAPGIQFVPNDATAFYQLHRVEQPLDPTDYEADRAAGANGYLQDPVSYWARDGIPGLSRLAGLLESLGETQPNRPFDSFLLSLDEGILLSELETGNLPPDFSIIFNEQLTFQAPREALISTFRTLVQEVDFLVFNDGDPAQVEGIFQGLHDTIAIGGFDMSALDFLAPSPTKELISDPPTLPDWFGLHGSDEFLSLTVTDPPAPKADDTDTTKSKKWEEISGLCWDTTYNGACGTHAVGPMGKKLGLLKCTVNCKEWNDLSQAIGAVAGTLGAKKGKISEWFQGKGYACSKAWDGLRESACEEAKAALDRGCALSICYFKDGKGHIEMVTGISVDAADSEKCTVTTLSWGQAATVTYDSGTYSGKSDGPRYRSATEAKSYLEGSGTAQLNYYCKK